MAPAWCNFYDFPDFFPDDVRDVNLDASQVEPKVKKLAFAGAYLSNIWNVSQDLARTCLECP